MNMWLACLICTYLTLGIIMDILSDFIVILIWPYFLLYAVIKKLKENYNNYDDWE